MSQIISKTFGADLLYAEVVGRHADVVQGLGHHPDRVVDQNVLKLHFEQKQNSIDAVT